MNARGKKVSWRSMSSYALGIVCFGIVLIGAAVPVAAQNVRISDYDVPVSRADRLEIYGSYRHAGRVSGRYDNTQNDYFARGQWMSFYNSLPFAWQVEADARLNARKISGQPAQYREIARFDGEIHRYLRNEGIFFVGARTTADWSYRHEHVETRVDAFAGIGRFIEATALAKAIRVEDFLLKEKILADHLPKRTMLELASIIDRRKEYQKLYGDTYWVQWYAEMDRIIVAGGLVHNNAIGAVGHLRMREAIEREHIRPRAHGWKVQAGTGKYFSQATKPGPAGVWQFLSAEFAYPINVRSQLWASAKISAPLYDDVDNRFNIMGSLNFSHELSNRIDFGISEAFSNIHDISDRRNSISYAERFNVLDVSFYFYLEDKLSVGLNGSLQHGNKKSRNINRYNEIVESREAYRNWRISSSVVYRIF